MRILTAAILAILVVSQAPRAGAVTTDDLAARAELEARKDFKAAKALIDAERVADAEPLLIKADAAQPNDPDILNLLGFVNRKQGRLAEARVFYDRALALDPDHRGAREYRGELFVESGDLSAARTELGELMRICGTECDEYRDLAAAIAAAGS